MIEFIDVHKWYHLKGQRRDIVRGLTISLPRGLNVALIGRNGAGKSTMLRMIGGVLRPDRGSIARHGRISWPMGFSGGFHPALTGRQNARFMARVYGADTDEMAEFVEAFAELGEFFDMPFMTYSSGMKARLAFGVSMAARFDCYLVDEITAVGDANFKRKCRSFFDDRLGEASVILASHSEATLKEYCQCALVLEKGKAVYYPDLQEGLRAYRKIIAA